MKTNKCLVCLLIFSLLILSSCSNPLGSREYYEDLYVDVPDTSYQLVIKEWNYLLGSGADVYFVDPTNQDLLFLGNLSGGDDGYCPFKDGKYSIEYMYGYVKISWSFTGSDTYSRSERFELPITESP